MTTKSSVPDWLQRLIGFTTTVVVVGIFIGSLKTTVDMHTKDLDLLKVESSETGKLVAEMNGKMDLIRFYINGKNETAQINNPQPTNK